MSATISWVSSMTGQSRERRERINFFKGHWGMGEEQPSQRDEGHRGPWSLRTSPFPRAPDQRPVSVLLVHSPTQESWSFQMLMPGPRPETL